MATLIQLRRDTGTNWSSENPVLEQGEVGVELGSPAKIKVGDGTTAWNSLPYFGGGGAELPGWQSASLQPNWTGNLYWRVIEGEGVDADTLELLVGSGGLNWSSSAGDLTAYISSYSGAYLHGVGAFWSEDYWGVLAVLFNAGNVTFIKSASNGSVPEWQRIQIPITDESNF